MSDFNRADQRHVLEGWLRKNAVSDMHATATKLEPSASLAKALELDARHVRALTPQQLVFAYLNYLRSHFKTPDTTPIEATPAPVNVPPTKKRISLTQNETPVWSNHDFPPLNAPTTSTATVHIMASKPKVQKDKRRIRSTLVATPSLVSTPSSSSSSIFTSTPVEKSHLPSQMNNDVLSKFETRLTSVTHKPAPIQTTIAPRQPQDAPQHNHPVAAASINNNSSNNNNHKSNHDHEMPSEMYDEPAEELEPMVAPTPMALFYSFLFQAQLVPLSAHEVQWLFTLLQHDASEAKEFALAVFYTIPETLELFGPEILKLAVDTFAALHVARSLQIRFLQYLEAYEDARSVASQAVGTSLPIEVVGHSARDFAVPFCEDTDSRLHFRSPAEAVLFSNREKARDAFLSLLRQWQRQRTSIEVCHVASLRNEMASVLDDVSANNLWWFAQFFVQELCQVGINPVGEHDVDLVEKIMHDDKLKNPDRLRKLHQRFTSQQAPKAKLGPSAHSTKFATNKGPSSSSTSSSSPSPSSSLHTSATASSDMAELFPENQLFFAQFLETTNHALFTRLVATVLEAQLFELEGSSSSSSSSSIRKTFTLHALQARLLARFLAYVHVAPYVNSLGAPTNVAIECARKQAIDMRNRVRAPLDVCAALGRCVSEHTLMASLPWLLEYLRILILRDPIACATRYVQSAVAHVRALFFSPRLESCRSENGLLLRLQLEAFLQTASTRLSLQPSVLDSLPLTDSLTIALDAPMSGLDAIPYLASSMFLAHCVPDVPSLRAFLLQLQATLTQGPAKPTTTRRLKVRPLTLSLLKNVDDDDQDQDEATPTMADDPLTRAFYKQYPSLQTTIEFVVDTSMTNVCQLVGPSVVVPSANAFMDTIALRVTHDETTAEKITAVVRRYVGQAKLDACTKAIAAAEPYCQEHIPRALESLLSPAMDARVKAMAVSLATQKALGTVRSVVAASMGMEFSKQVVQRVRKMAKPAPAVAATAPSLLDALHAAAKDAASSAACLDQYTALLHVARAAETTSVWCCVASVLHDERMWRLEAPASQKALLHHALRNHAWQPSAIALLEPLVRMWLRPDHIAAGRQHLETLCDAFPDAAAAHLRDPPRAVPC
ncbi:hypothetical protein SPRG_15038 [Saprolegnia parasitica CBS 223.65]|uniref:Uncharacterized protein n=1 Tax=Saprolegnia parasitica (strain CBS 223.65) TaxID=695850 RepID=A0A067BXH5_SAPPC|nr:hypothetical protein SPRG_15038 [Saprolegnia parasitica CBS 223.65]KDO19257.1 hypothetical protein SPRG_15038 [Saprolegnia parasitica CBS 223.65]|eukprot:XP_012210031.1 hypothetical protein SPRG_15038 [Saprolegnia parasitica CBS 223.65]